MCPSAVINSALYYSGRLQKKFPVRHELLPASTQLGAISINCKKYLHHPPMETSGKRRVNLERNHVHYAFVYHFFVKAAKNDSWNSMKHEWERRGKTHTPEEKAELLAAINNFTALLIQPVFNQPLFYDTEKLKQFLLNGHVPEEQIIGILEPSGASPRFSIRMDYFFQHFQRAIDSYRETWNMKMAEAPIDAVLSQEFQTVTHALGALNNVFDAYFEVF